MPKPRLVIKPSSSKTRLLLTSCDEEVLRAAMPPPKQIHPHAAAALLEGLSLWLGQRLSVALYADAEASSCGLGLCDDFGLGISALRYEVEVVGPHRRPLGMGSFRDLRRLGDRLALRGES